MDEAKGSGFRGSGFRGLGFRVEGSGILEGGGPGLRVGFRV